MIVPKRPHIVVVADSIPYPPTDVLIAAVKKQIMPYGLDCAVTENASLRLYTSVPVKKFKAWFEHALTTIAKQAQKRKDADLCAHILSVSIVADSSPAGVPSFCLETPFFFVLIHDRVKKYEWILVEMGQRTTKEVYEQVVQAVSAVCGTRSEYQRTPQASKTAAVDELMNHLQTALANATQALPPEPLSIM